ncbi:DUF6404 family protein [Pantoea sp. MBD-2R]|uniref:DUF6404 family protein n=1 Tax=unclassified Pantoea TaxID=2630326 RepID=UPI0011BDD9F7|nr:DUF6404 family protein [Pantoea sp. CCBC3-3-1]
MKSNLTFKLKKDRAIAIMAKKGMWQSLYAPPCHLFLWKMGISVAPPPFSSFWSNFLCFTSVNTTYWGIVMWIVFWEGRREELFSALMTIIVVGIVAGLVMSALEFWRGKANHLPEWDRV